MDTNNQIMIVRLPAGASIGTHRHTAGIKRNDVRAGAGKAVCGDVEVLLSAGVCQYYPKGSSHSMVNTGAENLNLFTVAPRQ